MTINHIFMVFEVQTMGFASMLGLANMSEAWDLGSHVNRAWNRPKFGNQLGSATYGISNTLFKWSWNESDCWCKVVFGMSHI